MIRKNNKYIIGGTLVYLILILLPFFGAISNELNIEVHIFSARRWALLANSIKLGVFASILAVFIGFFAAVFIRYSFIATKIYRYFCVLLLPIPYYIYALSWTYLIKSIASIDSNLLQYSMQGFWGCLFVEVMAFVPIAVLIILVGLESIDCGLIELATVYKKRNYVLYHIIFKLVQPYCLACFGIIFIFSITDFSIPSMFRYNTFALDIFSIYSRTGNAFNVYLISLILVLILIVPLGWIVRGIKNITLPSNSNHISCFKIKGIGKLISFFSIIFLIAQIIFPIIAFTYYTKNIANIITSFHMIKEELLLSIFTALIVACLIGFIVVPTAQFLINKNRIFLFIIFLLPMLIPGSISAIGFLKVINTLSWEIMQKTLLFPAMGCIIYFGPILLIFMIIVLKRVDYKKIEIAAIIAVSKKDFYKIKYRLLLPGILIITTLSFLMCLAEESIMLVLMPPGKEVASVKIYNYLHYGASEYVSGFCLIVILLIFVLESIIIGLYGLYKKDR